MTARPNTLLRSIMQVLHLLFLSIPLLAFVFFNPWLPSWGSRKVLHMGTGTLLMCVDARDPLFPWAVYAVTFFFVIIVCVRKLHFSDVRDVGIINYLLFLSICVTLSIPLTHVMGLFYADPMGAIVGRNVASRKLVGTKSFAGTVAVFLTATVTAMESSWYMAIVSGAAVAMIELFSGKWDNPTIGAWLLIRHFANQR